MFTLIIIWIQILTAAIIGTAILANQKRINVFRGTENRNKMQEPSIKSQESRNKNRETRIRSQDWNKRYSRISTLAY